MSESEKTTQVEQTTQAQQEAQPAVAAEGGQPTQVEQAEPGLEAEQPSTSAQAEVSAMENEECKVKDVSVIVRWAGSEYSITDLTNQDTVAVLRHEIYKTTHVKPERQKLLNLKYKGTPAVNNLKLSDLQLKPNFKIMMVGSTEAAIEAACTVPDDVYGVLSDLDDDGEGERFQLERSPIYLAKVQKRVKEYKIKELSKPREGKYLLVLDIDYTLFDHRSVAETGAELMRPYLHEFLEECYEYYDIAIWSATSMRWIEEKMRILGVSTNENYKILFYLDCLAMISVYTENCGVLDVKPLGVIWGKYKQYNETNTIMLDDIRRNFLMNPRSGLRIKPYRQAHINRDKDVELRKLAKYLKDIAMYCKNFLKLNHSKWQQYKPKK